MKTPDKLLWIDIETTGLDPNEDDILELAAVFTWPNGIPVVSWEWVFGPAPPREKMNDYVYDMHTENRLLDETAESPYVYYHAVEQLTEYLHVYRDETIYLAGSSVQFDRSFLQAQMPDILKNVHYRNLDVTSVITTMLAAGHEDDFVLRREGHRAMPDLQDSIGTYRNALRIMGSK